MWSSYDGEERKREKRFMGRVWSWYWFGRSEGTVSRKKVEKMGHRGYGGGVGGCICKVYMR